ncbi:UDP-xylose and UDP-N-acetylglucosamine transporter-like [Homarus americanus]|uniref:UDP-xylose and UDP-N-acetylglucosamine transporter-like n=1 Tax=Homarus americanus TaxID=6706 RepID=UPI001C44B273|nr:UDP-xylose and UDP-N-acetylglucosamine transporter-like [Homarus americanus]
MGTDLAAFTTDVKLIAALFFIHTLSLPGFLITGISIVDHVARFSRSAPLPALSQLPGLCLRAQTLALPPGYLCVSSVFRLTSECTALTVTLVLTLRKFLSLVFSIIYFQNPFTLHHWLGTFMVFNGTLLFLDIIQKTREALGMDNVKRE